MSNEARHYLKLRSEPRGIFAYFCCWKTKVGRDSWQPVPQGGKAPDMIKKNKHGYQQKKILNDNQKLDIVNFKKNQFRPI